MSKEVMREVVGLDQAGKEVIDIFGHEVTIYSAPEGMLIDPRESGFGEAEGSNSYEFFVDFGDLFEDFDMSGTNIAIDQRWNHKTLPDGVTVAEFFPDSEETTTALNAISKLDAEHGLLGWLDPVLNKDYLDADVTVAQAQGRVIGGEKIVNVGIARAGLLGLLATDVDYEDQVIVSEKRHNLLKDTNQIGVGVSLNGEDLDEITKSDGLFVRESFSYWWFVNCLNACFNGK